MRFHDVSSGGNFRLDSGNRNVYGRPMKHNRLKMVGCHTTEAIKQCLVAEARASDCTVSRLLHRILVERYEGTVTIQRPTGMEPKERQHNFPAGAAHE